MPLFLITALGWAKTALKALVDLVRRYPLQMALVALLCLSSWLWRGWDKADARNEALIAAAEQSEALHRAQIDADKAKFAKLKKETDDAYKTALADAGDRTDRFIDRNRVRAKSCPAQAAPAGQGEATGTPETSAAEAVLVDPADVRACSAAAVYAEISYRWAQDLMRAGLAN